MSENRNEQVIVAFLESDEKCDSAAEALMSWDKANEDIKLGAIGHITLEDGAVKIKQYGKSKTKRGALLGGALGVVAAGVTGGLSLVAGALGGGAIGGVVGKLDKDSFGLSDAAIAQIKKHLEEGGSGLVVLCDGFEVEMTMKELESLGGEPHSFGVSTKVLESIHGAMADEAVWNVTTDNIEKSM